MFAHFTKKVSDTLLSKRWPWRDRSWKIRSACDTVTADVVEKPATIGFANAHGRAK